MFYSLLVRFRNGAGVAMTQTFPFEHFDNAYAFASRRAKEILQVNPCWVLSEDREHKNFDKGTYTRDITLSDRSGNPKAVLRLENDFFLDDLVEKFPERYDPSDYPEHHDDTKNI
jgi:hypothetical protein